MCWISVKEGIIVSLMQLLSLQFWPRLKNDRQSENKGTNRIVRVIGWKGEQQQQKQQQQLYSDKYFVLAGFLSAYFQ